MTGGGSKVKEISLGDDLGDVAVKANGVRVDVHADGSIQAYTSGDVDAYANGSVRVHPAANDGSATAEPERLAILLRATASPRAVAIRFPKIR